MRLEPEPVTRASHAIAWRWNRMLVTVPVFAAMLWFASGGVRSMAAERAPRAPDIDPVQAAQEVFKNQEFWWKRIEPAQKISTSWFDSILTSVLDFLGRLANAILDWLAKLLAGLSNIVPGGASGGTIWVWLIVVAILAWSCWKLFPVLIRWLSRPAGTATTPEGVSWQTLPEASDLFEQARQAYRNGMNAETIRLSLLALIAKLEKQGLLRYDHTRTNREYQFELRHKSELAAPFGEVARIYERVWYGRWPAGRAEAEQAICVSGSLILGKDSVAENE
jgi:Domain of unknown function (DUF4129)